MPIAKGLDPSKLPVLSSLRIYRSFDDTYTADAEFTSVQSEVTLKLDAELATKIVQLCFDEIVASVVNVATNTHFAMAAALPQSDPVPAIEPPPTDDDLI